MADQEQICILARGVADWNQWRQTNPRIPVNLVNAALRMTDLRGADFHGANLCGADLSGADFSGANLQDAVFLRADLRGTGLRQARLEGANMSMCRGLTQKQIDSARTETRTQVMPPLQTGPLLSADQ